MDKRESTAEGHQALSEPSPAPEPPAKKRFIEPEISIPVDVLEATTYFQAVDSGTTN